MEKKWGETLGDPGVGGALWTMPECNAERNDPVGSPDFFF